ncbi:oligomeric golgi complex component, COG2-domain-containing protein [Kockovaella imperatae]|uniref:Conserved oligomeric Golgi complex subunit 2 n=1 Tax=Kockovaella imperatae TaxID=4999 RepID=A0A1Y1UCW2_9TREE|nr:oligomeric golgi complex component, COG2-domain-containing protein [Kockovaella imperatae]ORX35364.1 oligomeric golgi complex component, COG2-domain-containing protein [Kockovaella imperatae]
MEGDPFLRAPEASPRPSTERSLDLPSLQPLSHNHPLLSAPDFNVDTFLLSRIYIPLEELRAELREYLGVLREELVQLINDDYEEFISLGTGLRGEGERLKSLQEPLHDLQSEVGTVRDKLKVHQDAIQEQLDERATLREEKTLLDLLQRLFDTLDRAESLLDGPDEDRSKLVQRAASEYNQLVYLIGKAAAEGCQIVDAVTPRVEAIKLRLGTDLAALLRGAMDSPGKIKSVLKTYELIEGYAEAAEVVRTAFRAFCQDTITSTTLMVPNANLPETPQTPITPMVSVQTFDFSPDKLADETPLATLFNRVLTQVQSYSALLTISDDLSPQFDLYSSVIWPEVAEAIMDKLGSTIFAAGRPDDLHQNYTITHDFIAHLESLAPSGDAIISARSSPISETFERRWQLPVYFQLRWKEIVTSLETALAAPSTATAPWCLSQSAAAWKAISTCFDDKVFLPELAHRFWRLTLQISARYNTWLRTRLEECSSDEAGDDQALRHSASAVADLATLRLKIRDVPRITSLHTHLDIPTDPYTAKIIDILTRRCSDSLKLVRAVASQFRAAPSKSAEITPSYFIPSILKPLHDFYASRPTLATTYGPEWSTTVFDAVCVAYAGILAGVRKTEDLLRRHRKTKKGGFSLFGGGTPQEDSGEEDRFKRQMQVDIEALRADARKLGVEVENLNGWKELVDVVNRPPE